MIFELAISTMHKTREQIIAMLNSLHIDSDCLIINQCNSDDFYCFEYKGHKIKCFFSNERGLSKSRNMAIDHSEADILAFADDDLLYYPKYKEIILSAFQKNPDKDIIIFNIDDYSKEFPTYQKIPSFFNLFGFISMQVAIRRQSIIDKNIRFNIHFGSGSKKFLNGEENIFLSECYRSDLKILYVPEKILSRVDAPSTWFHGYNDPQYIVSKGAIFYAISPGLVYFLILQFALRKRRLLHPVTFLQSIRYMLQGMNEYKSLIS